jgi:hypothetical protein
VRWAEAAATQQPPAQPRAAPKPNGSLAAAVLVNDLDPRLHLIRADRSGVQELAVDVDPGSLALARSRIYWTVAGVPQTATLD